MSRGTPDPAVPAAVPGTGLSPSPAGLPRAVPLPVRITPAVLNPGALRAPVWARPVSLAATPGITFVFSSSGYLDVSVHRVPPMALWRLPPFSRHGGRVFPGRVSPFRHPRITAHVRLPAAFRSLSRLSSALSAKASALCPSLLNLRLFMPLPLPPYGSQGFSYGTPYAYLLGRPAYLLLISDTWFFQYSVFKAQSD